MGETRRMCCCCAAAGERGYAMRDVCVAAWPLENIRLASEAGSLSPELRVERRMAMRTGEVVVCGGAGRGVRCGV